MRHIPIVLPFAAAAILTTATPAVAATMSAKPVCVADTRACMERTARLYIDALVSHDGSKLPLAPGVRRTENALTNAKGPHEVIESFARTTMVESVADVRFFTDVQKREVIAFFLLNVDLKAEGGGGDSTTKAGNTEYQVSVTKPAGTYTVHEAERFRVIDGTIHAIEIIAHVEDGKGLGSGWPVERAIVVKK